MGTCLVTGGCGYLGSVLVKHLLENTDYNILIIDKGYFGIPEFADRRVSIFKCDIRSIAVSSIAFKDIDAVVHLAALSNDASAELNPPATQEINVEGTRAMLELCKFHNIKKFLFASTSCIYGCNLDMVDETAPEKPLSLYGQSKLEAERIVKSYSDFIDDIIIMRFATMFGYSPRFRTDLVVNTMIKSALTRSEINVVGNGEQWRPHIHVNDLARIIAFLLLNNKKRCETYNLVHFNLTVEQLAIILQSLLYENFDRIIKINYSDENMLDKRNYNISGKKFIDDFGIDFPYGIIFMNNILSGAKEIINEWDKGIIDFNNPIYNNVEWLGEIDLEERF